MAERARQSQQHPPPMLILALVGELPPEDKPFPRRARERWLAALTANLDLIYGGEDEGSEDGEDG